MASTPRTGHAPINMFRLPDGQTVADDIEPDECLVGMFRWVWSEDGGHRILMVAVPAPTKSGFLWTEFTIGHKNRSGASWSWDGNEDRPTLTPSLHAVGIWHGWVRAGQLIEA